MGFRLLTRPCTGKLLLHFARPAAKLAGTIHNLDDTMTNEKIRLTTLATCAG